MTVAACFAAAVFAAEPAAAPTPGVGGWAMHHVRDDYLIANSLNAADVNGDGFDDYAVIDEFSGSQTIIFHPGPGGDVRAEWPRVVLGYTGNPEYSCLGDLDGDGNLDLCVVEGDDLEKGFETGVRFFWGPDAARAADPAAWVDAGRVPGTGGNQFLYAEARDLNADGGVDVVVGGRRHSATGRWAGIRWLECPADPADRRDLAKWSGHFIDADTPSGHGFLFTDVDADGLDDLVDANADLDTGEFQESLHWYRNPGPASAGLRGPWEKTVIWRNSAFYSKPQVAAGDLDGDGLTDLAVQTQNQFHLFRKTSTDPVTFSHREVDKPDFVQWVGRPAKIADLDGDGREDVIFALIHNDGNLPADKAAVFYLKNVGWGSLEDWPAVPIKWSDGANTRHQWRGEKWDGLLVRDVDRDGDSDLIGNVEEHFDEFHGRDESAFSVVWFENPLN